MMLGGDEWLRKPASLSDNEKLRRQRLAKHKKQRRERGWSTYDAWNADTFLLQLIGEIALWHRDHGIGFPASLEEDEWKDILTRIAEPLLAYTKGKFDTSTVEQENELWQAAHDALHLYAKWFAALWD